MMLRDHSQGAKGMFVSAKAILIALAISATAAGQAINGTIVGTITDSTGAVVVNAKIAMVEVNTNLNRSTVANESGNFSFANVPQGKYTVSVEQAGFRKTTRENVDVTINSTVRVDLQ